MTFLEKYKQVDKWHEKAIIIELYHLAMKVKDEDWNITKTANYFQISIGLVSENLKLAKTIHTRPEILLELSKDAAMRKIK